MKSILVYGGFWRETTISKRPKIVENMVFEISCTECEGTGKWNYFAEEIPEHPCVTCKGTGKQYIGI